MELKIYFLTGGENLEYNYYDGEIYYNTNKVMDFLFILVVILSNFSQLPALVSTSATSILSTPTWIVFGLVLLIICNFKIMYTKSTKFFMSVSLFFIILVMLLSVFTSNALYSGSSFRAFIISLMVFSVGCVSSEFLNQRLIDKMQIAYIVTLIIVGGSIYLQYFVGYDISSVIYGYSSKNSVSTMFLAAIVFLMFGLNSFKTTGVSKIIRVCLVFYFTILMGIMKSRASLIGLAVIGFALFMNRKIKTFEKILIVIAIIVLIWHVLNNEALYQLIVNDILYAGRDASSISSLSSGRTDQIKNTLILLSYNPFVGLGPYYIDCFPVSSWANYGYIIGTVLIIISLYPFISSIRKLNLQPYLYDFRFTGVVLAGAYSLNSLFEGLAPFGPGIKCYILWFFFGVLCNFDESRKAEEFLIKY